VSVVLKVGAFFDSTLYQGFVPLPPIYTGHHHITVKLLSVAVKGESNSKRKIYRVINLII
jgi:hypothetical protein